MARGKVKLFNATAQIVCKRKGWTSSDGLPTLFNIRATTQANALKKAKAEWRKRGHATRGRGCVLHPSVEEI